MTEPAHCLLLEAAHIELQHHQAGSMPWWVARRASMTPRPLHRQIGQTMAAQLSLASATVTNDEGEVIGKDEPVLIRENVLRIGVGHDRRYEHVQSVTAVGRNRWEVRFPTSVVLTVDRGAPCGPCTGRA